MHSSDSPVDPPPGPAPTGRRFLSRSRVRRFGRDVAVEVVGGLLVLVIGAAAVVLFARL